jgi:hypothetical protein
MANLRCNISGRVSPEQSFNPIVSQVHSGRIPSPEFPLRGSSDQHLDLLASPPAPARNSAESEIAFSREGVTPSACTISLLTELGLGSRIVTNGHWARNEKDAARWIDDLVSAGLNELNLSTGDEHLEWVPIESVARAALYAARRQLLTIVTIEGSADARFRLDEFQRLPQIRELLNDKNLRKWFLAMTNVWMPFHAGTGIRPEPHKPQSKGCDNIFENFVANPYGSLMSCCGLTMEYIPEMKVGRVDEPRTLQQVYSGQFEDLLKLWIWLDGTQAIFDLAVQRSGQSIRCTSPHHCAICAQLYRDPRLRSSVRDLVIENANQIVFRPLVKARLNGRIDVLGRQTHAALR